MPLGEGSVLGRRYRLLSQIGRGGMGRVWYAHDDVLDRDVAVKEVIFPPGLSAAERGVLFERTLREARSAARLSHPGIVTVHDVVEEDGRPWIVMELVRARSLQDVIDHEPRLTAPQVARIGVQMLAALRTAHAAGILHRDVKPANVLLDTSRADRDTGAPRVVITDFGIARMEGDATLTQAGLVLGSPAYIAPERIRGDRATPASDLWALGATLYAACEGRPPHDRTDAMAALSAVLTEDPRPPRHAGPLAPLLMGLLAKDPARRLTADRAADDLARAAHAPASPATTRPPPDPGATLLDVPDGMTMLDPPTTGESRAEQYTRPVRERPPRPGHSTQEGTSPPAYGVPRRSSRDGRKGPLLIGLALLGVALAVAVVTFVIYRSGRGAPAHRASGSPSAAAATPTGSATAPAGSAFAVPAGYRPSTGPGGERLVVPAGWTRQTLSGSSVKWTESGTGAHIQVDSIPWGVTDPVEHWRQFQSDVVRKSTLPGFEPIRLGGRFAARGWSAADYEYTWLTQAHGRLRAYDRGFTANGHQYAILVAAPADGWNRYAGHLDTIFQSFTPAP